MSEAIRKPEFSRLKGVRASRETDRDRLALAAAYLSSGDTTLATEILLDLSAPGEASDLKTELFRNALLKRIGRGEDDTGNLYLLDSNLKQIDLFNVLATKFPLVSMAGWYANECLIPLLSEAPDATLVDVGMGTGQQLVAMVRQMAASGRLPRKLSVIGIEPAANCLEVAAASFASLEREHGIEIPFRAIHARIEDLRASDWSSLSGAGQPLVFNEAFALHHVTGRSGDDDDDAKDAAIRRIRDLRPLGFVLSEPESDHETADLRSRFMNAWKHFGLVFDVIDRIDIPLEQRKALKVVFFAREIEDILGSSEDRRYERHETSRMWLDRLGRAGFAPRPKPEISGAPTSPLIDCKWKGDRFSLELENEPIVSVISVS